MPYYPKQMKRNRNNEKNWDAPIPTEWDVSILDEEEPGRLRAIDDPFIPEETQFRIIEWATSSSSSPTYVSPGTYISSEVDDSSG